MGGPQTSMSLQARLQHSPFVVHEKPSGLHTCVTQVSALESHEPLQHSALLEQGIPSCAQMGNSHVFVGGLQKKEQHVASVVQLRPSGEHADGPQRPVPLSHEPWQHSESTAQAAPSGSHWVGRQRPPLQSPLQHSLFDAHALSSDVHCLPPQKPFRQSSLQQSLVNAQARPSGEQASEVAQCPFLQSNGEQQVSSPPHGPLSAVHASPLLPPRERGSSVPVRAPHAATVPESNPAKRAPTRMRSEAQEGMSG
jgi:hypothetical protein